MTARTGATSIRTADRSPVGRSIRRVIREFAVPRSGNLLSGWMRWVALTVFAALVGVGLVPPRPSPAAAGVAAAIAIGAAAVLVWQPKPYLLAAAVLATAGVAVLGHGSSTNLAWFTVCLLGSWCALIGTRRDVLVYWAGTVLWFAADWLWIKPDPGWGAWIAGSTLSVGLGLLIRRERDLVAQLRAAQAGLADRARAEERNRIARDLHDIIGHSLSVSLLHVTSARLAVEHGLGDAARALAEAERLGRESLDEVRMAVGMLHEDGASSRTMPLPGAGDVPALVAQFRSAGADAALDVEGDIALLPAASGLAVYRILQEALTNAVRHAPGARIAVQVTVASDEVELVVDTSGGPRTGTGIGLLTMSERAESLGGTCEAGPGGSGWLVRATLPLEPSRRREGAR
jgi:signal transduction histidine kinase